MQRFEDSRTTIYEIRVPSHGLGMDVLVDGTQMGFGMCINDGDTGAGQGGQKGWGGWAPYSSTDGMLTSSTKTQAIFLAPGGPSNEQTSSSAKNVPRTYSVVHNLVNFEVLNP